MTLPDYKNLKIKVLVEVQSLNQNGDCNHAKATVAAVN